MHQTNNNYLDDCLVLLWITNFLCSQIGMTLCLWWAHWTRHWSYEGFAITLLTLKRQCHERTEVLLRGENATNNYLL